LTSVNPLADPIQAGDELFARELFSSPEVREGELTVAEQLLTTIRPLRLQSYASLFDALQQLTLANTTIATDSDPDRPHFVHLEAQPHEVKGTGISGTLELLNNPDVVYRQTSVEGQSRYVVTGKRYRVPSIDSSFSVLSGSNLATVANLSGSDLNVGTDGTFQITVDSTPGDGRGNHLQIPLGTSRLLVRDTLGDEATERPNDLQIQRVSGPEAMPLPSLSEYKAKAAKAVFEGYGFLLNLNKLIQAAGVNTFAQPLTRIGSGELLTQLNSIGHLVLANDEAFVLTLRMGGARYMSVPATSIWQVESDFVEHTTSLNTTQAIPNADGTYTFVISATDPGVYNWIDTVGQQEVVVQTRWQGLPAAAPQDGGPAVVSQHLVKLSELQTILPAGMPRITQAERAVQIRQRIQSFSWRRPTG